MGSAEFPVALLQLVQTLAVMEILHSMAGLVRAPITRALPQASPRPARAWSHLLAVQCLSAHSYCFPDAALPTRRRHAQVGSRLVTVWYSMDALYSLPFTPFPKKDGCASALDVLDCSEVPPNRRRAAARAACMRRADRRPWRCGRAAPLAPPLGDLALRRYQDTPLALRNF